VLDIDTAVRHHFKIVAISISLRAATSGLAKGRRSTSKFFFKLSPAIPLESKMCGAADAQVGIGDPDCNGASNGRPACAHRSALTASLGRSS